MVRCMSSLFFSRILPMTFFPLGLKFLLKRSEWVMDIPMPQCALLVHLRRGVCLVFAILHASVGF